MHPQRHARPPRRPITQPFPTPVRRLARVVLTTVVAGGVSFASVPDASAVPAAVPDASWVANGRVWSFLQLGDRIFIGGSFDQLSPPTGSGVSLDPSTAAIDPTMPPVKGVIETVLADGTGGWFLGGSFSEVGPQILGRLTHIDASGAIASFKPKPNNTVDAMALSPDGSILYIGGSFTTVKGQPRSHLAAVNAATGALLPWDPGANGSVLSLAVTAEGNLYVGGSFTIVGGKQRANLALIDPTGLTLSWHPDTDGPVQTLAAASDGSVIYAGGSFLNAGGAARANIAALSPSGTGAALASWHPDTDGPVRALTLSPDGTSMYVGGLFSTLAAVPRQNIGDVSTADGTPSSWDPSADGAVSALSVSADGLHVVAGGSFLTAGGQPRLRLASLDASTGAAEGGFVPNPNAAVTTLARSADGSHIFAGGAFTGLGGVLRKGIAALDATTGIPIDGWDPGTNGTVFALAASPDGSKLYAGGTFTSIGGLSRTRLAQLDPATGVVNSAFRAGVNNRVRALATEGDLLYIGGEFTSIAGIPRSRLAAIDISTGALDSSWKPSADSMVRTIAPTPDGTRVFFAGDFLNVSGVARQHLASVDATTGALTLFLPSRAGVPMYKTFQIAISGTTVYAAVGGPSGGRLRAFEDSLGNMLWNTEADGDVQAVTVLGGLVYIGGHFDTLGGLRRGSIGAADATTGVVDPWLPRANGSLWSLYTSGSRVFAGGDFAAVTGSVHQGYAVFSDV